MAYVSVSQSYGIGMAVDIESNCRYYDMHRFVKFAKINATKAKIAEEWVQSAKFKLLNSPCLEMLNDSFIGVI